MLDYRIFYGFTPLVWLQVCLFALGRLLVAAVIQRADNVVKGVAVSSSVMLSTWFSSMLFNTPITSTFIVGAVMVLTASFLYTRRGPEESRETVTKKYYAFLVGCIALLIFFFAQSWGSTSLHEAKTDYEDVISPSLRSRATTALWSTGDVHFHIMTRESHDCGGCLVLSLLTTALRRLGYSVTTRQWVDGTTAALNKKLVIVYPEVDVRRVTAPNGRDIACPLDACAS
jgi:hypothetical protein